MTMTRGQFGQAPASALTVHKAQGRTCWRAMVEAYLAAYCAKADASWSSPPEASPSEGQLVDHESS